MKPRRKRCRTCLVDFMPRNSLAVVCSSACAILYYRKQEAKKARKERREGLVKLRTVRDWTKIAQVAFNRYIRERDKFEPCICCGKWTSDEDLATGSRWDAGHYRSTGAAAHLRFNEDNAHKQRVVCNRNKSGNVVEYRIRLIAKIGLERVTELEHDNTPHKWTVDELKRITSLYREKLRALRKGERSEAA